MSRRDTLRLLAVGLLLCWCGIFLRGENTEKSMVRALLVERGENGWTVGFLYQSPEAAADSSEAAAAVRLCTASGETLEEARLAAEALLPQTANYRLCDYLVVEETSAPEVLAECAALEQKHPELRMAMRVLAADCSCKEWLAAAQEDESVPEKLLACIKEAAPAAPRLYERDAGLLLPVAEQGTSDPGCAEEGLLLSASGAAVRLTAAETQMAYLLQERSGQRSFWLAGQAVLLRRAVVGVEVEGEGFAVRLTVQPKAGTALLSKVECRELEALCTETVRRCWENGLDVLSLGAVRALQDEAAPRLTTKNVCPQLRADVQCLG